MTDSRSVLLQPLAASAAAPPRSAERVPAGPDDVGVPWAGLILILVMLCVAIVLRRSEAAARWVRLGILGGKASGSGTDPDRGKGLYVSNSIRLDARSQLHVVNWNGRQLLVATHAENPPVLLDRRTMPSDGAAGGQA